MLACANHPDQAATLECAPCRALLCVACTRPLKAGAGKTYECLRCGGMVLPLAPTLHGPSSRAAFDLDTNRPLLERLGEAPRWLAHPTVAFLLATVAIFNYLCSFLPFTRLVAAGVSAALFFDIVTLTAEGRSRVDTPEFLGFMESIVLPQLKYLATVLPFILVVILAGQTLIDALELPPLILLRAVGPYLVLVLLWVVLWPCLIIVGAITNSVAAILDPRAWFRAVQHLGRDYFVAAAAFYAVLAATTFVVEPVFGWLARLPIPVLPSLLGHSVLVFLMALRARILGEACRPHMGL